MLSIITVLALVAFSQANRLPVKEVIETVRPGLYPAYGETVIEKVRPAVVPSLGYGSSLLNYGYPAGYPAGHPVSYPAGYPVNAYGYPYNKGIAPVYGEAIYPEVQAAGVEGDGAWIPGAGFVPGYPFTYMRDSFGGRLPPGGDNTVDTEPVVYDGYGQSVVETYAPLPSGKIVEKVVAPYSPTIVKAPTYYKR